MGLQGNRRGTPSTCEICGTPHHSYQGHVFATNRNATNTDATNRAVLDHRQPEPIGPDVPSCAGGVKRNVTPVVGQPRSANRRARESYNAYQLEYMRKRRAKSA